MNAAAGAVAAPGPSAVVDELLAPIPGDDPAGESLRYDVIHDEIRELRREDDPTLPQGVWRHELKKADWRGLERLVTEALRKRSKDLQMGVWLAEAWARLEGLPGLERGVSLLCDLIERYGDGVHPRPDTDDGEDPGDSALRVAALGRLESGLAEALRSLPLTRPRGDDGEVCTWGQWKRALYLENLGASHPDASDAGGVDRESFLASVGATPAGFYRPLAAGAEACRAVLARLAELADERYGAEAPAFRSARDELASIARLAGKLAAERGEDAEPVAPPTAAADSVEADADTLPADPADAVPEGGTAASARSANDPPCRITDRAEAYRALEQAAEVLLRMEPHSPVPYLVKRAVRWGSLSLSELYAELFQIADPSVVFRLLGIQREDRD